MRMDYNLIPKCIIEKGLSLGEFGILEYAWTLNDIRNIIKVLTEHRVSILGGDVYKICDSKLFRTYDSWYINKFDEFDFYSKSYEKTISYILNYEKNNEGQFVYSIIFD